MNWRKEPCQTLWLFEGEANGIGSRFQNRGRGEATGLPSRPKNLDGAHGRARRRHQPHNRQYCGDGSKWLKAKHARFLALESRQCQLVAAYRRP
jgi:hypothetical protein